MDDGRRQLSNSEREALLAIEERLRHEDHALAEFLSRGVIRPPAAVHGSPAQRVLRRLSPAALLAIAVTLFIVSRAIDDLFTPDGGGFLRRGRVPATLPRPGLTGRRTTRPTSVADAVQVESRSRSIAAAA